MKFGIGPDKAEVEDSQLLNETDGIFGNLLGLLIGDRLSRWRLQNLASQGKKFQQFCEEKNIVPNWSNVNKKFLLNWFTYAQQEENEQIQDIWIRLLASETKESESISIRTLNALQEMSKSEAGVFEKYFPYFIKTDGPIFLPNNVSYKEKYNISFEDLLTLQDAGLLDISSDTQVALRMAEKNFIILNEENAVQFQSPDLDEQVNIPAFRLTQTGFEIFNSLGINQFVEGKEVEQIRYFFQIVFFDKYQENIKMYFGKHRITPDKNIELYDYKPIVMKHVEDKKC